MKTTRKGKCSYCHEIKEMKRINPTGGYANRVEGYVPAFSKVCDDCSEKHKTECTCWEVRFKEQGHFPHCPNPV